MAAVDWVMPIINGVLGAIGIGTNAASTAATNEANQAIATATLAALAVFVAVAIA